MGCVELCIPGKEYAHTEGARLNWAKVLEDLLADMQNKKNFSRVLTFNDFYHMYKQHLLDTARKICEFIDFASGMYPRRWSVPFATVFMDGTRENGRDVTDNGTIYNNLTINCVGIATAVDSLQAVKELVYERKTISLEQLADICLTNKGYEVYIDEMLKCKKYGNDYDEVDLLATELIAVFNKTVTEYPLKYRTGKMMVGYYSSYFHADFGNYTSATPDGRKAWTPLSPSLSPSSGKDKNGVLSYINSANKIDMSTMSNGAALDLKYTPTFFDKRENRDALKTVIQTYFEKGGLEVQINVIDREELLDAKKHPENHMNLIVRVSGFSAHFVNLDSNLQDEIIRRTEL